MDGAQVSQGYRATMRSLPEIPGTHYQPQTVEMLK